MKKSVSILLFAICVSTFAVAGDFSFVFDSIETHPEFLYDFFPTYYRAGCNYSGFELIEGNMTEVILVGGAGYGHTKLWTDYAGLPFGPGSVDTENETFRDLQSYNSVLLDADLRLQQSLNPVVVPAPGKLAAYLEYGIAWMNPLENGDGSYGLDGTDKAYPDNPGALWNEISVGVFLDTIEKAAVRSGYRGEVVAAFAPRFLANSVIGETNYKMITGSFVSYFPIYAVSQANGFNLFGIYLADRAAAILASGDAFPQREQYPIALGTLVRGFEKNSFGTSFVAVNNFEVRFSGPELLLRKLYPRLHLFFDVGAYAGEYLNTGYKDSGVIASTGFEAALSLVDLFSAGYRGAFAVKGNNVNDSVYTGGIMLNLQF